jgi:hypothetical protein
MNGIHAGAHRKHRKSMNVVQARAAKGLNVNVKRLRVYKRIMRYKITLINDKMNGVQP